MHLHFPKCSVCPVAGLDCHAQRTGANHAYCRRIRAGDQHARALVIDHSEPLPDPVETAEVDDSGGVSEKVIQPDPAPVARVDKPRVPLGTPHCIPCQQSRSQG